MDTIITNQKILLKLYIGISSTSNCVQLFPRVANEIAHELTFICGGLSWDICKGTWIDINCGKFEDDVSAWYEIACLPCIEKTLLHAIYNQIPQILYKHEMPIKNIHIQRSECSSQTICVYPFDVNI